MKQAYNTAVLLFARSARSEAEHKSLLGKAGKRNYRIASELLDKARTVCRSSRYDFIEISDGDQIGMDFGTRIVQAIKTVSEKGYRNVIVVGSDCPELSIEDLHSAGERLQSDKCVLGPAFDGGVYLIGLQIAKVDLNELRLVEWNSRMVLTQLRVLLDVPFELATKKDIDHVGSWSGVMHLFSRLIALVKSFLFGGPGVNPQKSQSITVRSDRGRRGPPRG